MTRLLIALMLIAVRDVTATDCGVDGDHKEIDIKSLQIRYDGLSIQETFQGLVKLGLQIKPLQTAAVETQKLNQYLQALVAGYNNCAITRQQYSAATRLMLGTRQDLESIDLIRSQLAEGQKGLAVC